jgi:hypothetical protein
MIPATYPTTVDGVTGQREMVTFELSDVTGLTRWVDYIPVVTQLSGTEGTYDSDGYIAEDRLVSDTGLIAWIDYIPVYEDGSATDRWVVSDVGFIPVAASGT